jgi:hypothetical protein
MDSESPVRTFGVGQHTLSCGTTFRIEQNQLAHKIRKTEPVDWQEWADCIILKTEGCKQVHGQNWKRFTKGVLWQQFTSVYDKTLEHSDNLYVVVGGLRWLPFERLKAFQKLWDNFRKTHTAMSLAAKWKTCVLVSDRKISKQMHDQCNFQEKIENVILMCVWREQRKVNKTDLGENGEKNQGHYLDHTYQELDRFSVYLNDNDLSHLSPSVVGYAYVLFQRLLATFEGKYTELESWFVNRIPSGQFGTNLHSFSEEAKAIAMGNGILCTMFAVCLHFAHTMLEDDDLKNRTYAAIVFWHADAETSFEERELLFKQDFTLLHRATLKRLGYNVHVDFQAYMAGVQDLPLWQQTQKQKAKNEPARFDQNDKDAILQMLRNNDKEHVTEFEADKYTQVAEGALQKSRLVTTAVQCYTCRHRSKCLCVPIAGTIRYTQPQLRKQEAQVWK